MSRSSSSRSLVLLAIAAACVLVALPTVFVTQTRGDRGASLQRGADVQSLSIEAGHNVDFVALNEAHQDQPDAGSAPGVALRAALAILAAIAVAAVPFDSAEAARSGGRMGGGGMGGGRSSFRAPPRATPPPSSRGAVGGGAAFGGPNISIGVSPFGYSPFGFGGFGFSPFGFGMPIPMPSGPSATDQALQNQQRQDERTIDAQKLQIDQLQREINEMKAKTR